MRTKLLFALILLYSVYVRAQYQFFNTGVNGTYNAIQPGGIGTPDNNWKVANNVSLWGSVAAV